LDEQLQGQGELFVDTAEDPSVAEFVTFLTKFCNAAAVGSQAERGRKRFKNKFQTKTTGVVYSSIKPKTYNENAKRKIRERK